MVLRVFLFLLFSSQILPAAQGGRTDMRKPGRVQPSPATETKESEAETVSSEAPQAETPKPVAPVASPRREETVLSLPKPGQGPHLAYYGHAFVYLTSKSGVRVAVNPYTEGSVSYPIPKNLTADIVLISSEVADHSGGQHLFGVPQIFRSLTGLGANRANGLPFKGIETYRDDVQGRNLGRNTVYVMEIDGVRFCHLGTLGHPLTSKQADAIGRVDVLFLPVGLPALTNRDLWKIVEQLKAKWIVPVTYKTPANANNDLRTLAEFDLEKHPAREVNSSEFTFTVESLPSLPSVLILKTP